MLKHSWCIWIANKFKYSKINWKVNYQLLDSILRILSQLALIMSLKWSQRGRRILISSLNLFKTMNLKMIMLLDLKKILQDATVLAQPLVKKQCLVLVILLSNLTVLPVNQEFQAIKFKILIGDNPSATWNLGLRPHLKGTIGKILRAMKGSNIR